MEVRDERKQIHKKSREEQLRIIRSLGNVTHRERLKELALLRLKEIKLI